DSAPHNQYQVAMYADNNGKPGTLLAKSPSGTLIANTWNTVSIPTTLAANTYYWLMYNTNSTNNSLNNLKYTNTGTLIGIRSTNTVVFGTWPQTFNSTKNAREYSLYATYTSP